MNDSEVAYWLRVLNTAKEVAVLQQFADGSTITVIDVVRSRFMSMGLKLAYNEKEEIYYVTAIGY